MVGPDKKFCPSDKKSIFVDWIETSISSSVSDDSALLIEIANKYSTKIIVLDDYKIDSKYQKKLVASKLHFLIFDNNSRDKIFADIVLNTNPVINKNDYKSKIFNDKSKLLLGPRYSIIKDEFPPESNLSIPSPTKILITFGGGDDRGAILFVLKALTTLHTKNVKFIVVSGENNPNNQMILDWIKINGSEIIEMQINPSPISQVFASCKIAIMSGGSTIYEIASIGLPMILIAIAKNQIKHSEDWQKVSHQIKYLGAIENIKSKDLINTFNRYILEQFSAYNDNVKPMVDGLGRDRVAQKLIKLKKYAHNFSD